MKKILLTGGGTAGHVTPNLALIPELRAEGFEIHYAGSENGIERGLIKEYAVKYHVISAGKLRRYFNLKNFTDVFRTIKGVFDAMKIIKNVRPDIVFSKGGFVSTPVVAAAWLKRVPAVIHESDLTPGLANKISGIFAQKICVAFPETVEYVSKKKAVLTGTPVRGELFAGEKTAGAQLCSFEQNGKPVIMVIGGSSGSAAINKCVRSALPVILQKFSVVHLCGKGNLTDSEIRGYAQFDYVKNELPHLYALADLIVSRAGANTISEILVLCKPSLLIPLPKASKSRGDQLQNADSIHKQGLAEVLQECDMNEKTLTETIVRVYNERDIYVKKMKNAAGTDEKNGPAKKIMGTIMGVMANAGKKRD